MGRLSMWPAVLGVALAMIVVNVLVPIPHSLAYASAAVVLFGLLGWIVEAREVAGPPPAVEPEHEEEEEAPGPSYWPLVLSLGIVGIAVGLISAWEYGGLVVAVPLALISGAAWLSTILKEFEAQLDPETEEPLSARPVVHGGRLLMPVPTRTLAAEAAGGAAIAIERVGSQPISRRGLLRVTFWASLGAGIAAIGAAVVDMLYPRGITGFGGVIPIGTVDEYPPGSQIPEGRFWLVNLTEEQGGPGFLALWWKCPHLGCTVPWLGTYSFPDPATGADKRGWFRCPCHGSTYNDAGVRVFGPAPRSLDVMELTIDPNTQRISVNTGSVIKGTPENAQMAVQG